MANNSTKSSGARGAKLSGASDWLSNSDTLLSVATQALALLAIFYAVIRFGAKEPTAQMHVCLMVIAAMVLVPIRSHRHSFVRPKIVIGICLCWVAWLAVSLLQSTSLPHAIVSTLSPQTASLRAEFGAQSSPTLSLIPSMTQNAWPLYALGFAFFLVGAAGFNSRRARTAFLIAISLGGGLFACWGLIQRSRGSIEMLPGIAAEESFPFSTIVYKNAAASIMLAAIATGIGLVLVLLRPMLRNLARTNQKAENGSSRKRSSGYGVRVEWVEPHAIALYMLLALLALGIVVSLSRGAWIAGLTALVVTGWVMRHYFSAKKVLIFGSIAVLLAGVAVKGMGLTDRVLSRASKTNIETLAGNDRISHWMDSAETVLQFPLLGSGLGTYGYATLPNQDADTARWFEHAHNQPLEWAVEMGLVGIVVVLTGIAIVVSLLVQLYRDRRNGSTPLIWFVVSTFAFIALIVQSVADFVVVTPAVMWLYALILGVGCSAVADGSKARAKGIHAVNEFAESFQNKFAQFIGRRLSGSFVWSVVAIGGLLISQYSLQADVVDEKLLASTRVPKTLLMPTEEQIDDARDRLMKRAKTRQFSGKLWQRLALWDLAQYRLDLVNSSKTEAQTLSWQDTDTSRIFGVYHSLDSESQTLAKQDWTFGEQRKAALAAAQRHFQSSVNCNPMVPQVHLQVAWMTPLIDGDWKVASERSQRLSASNGDLQFASGFLAYHVDDLQAMKTLWRRGLRYKPQNLKHVVKLASQKLSSDELVTQVLGELRPSIWVQLVNESQEDPSLEPLRSTFVEAAIIKLREDKAMNRAKQQYQLALMNRYRGDDEQALSHLHRAVTAEPSNPDYRFQLAITLLRKGNLTAAREEASLGRALAPRQPRWNNLIDKIDRQLASYRKSVNHPEITSAPLITDPDQLPEGSRLKLR